MKRVGKPPWELVQPTRFSNLQVIDFQNSKNKAKLQKMIDDRDLIGYVVLKTPTGPATVRPIYRGQAWLSPAGGRDKGTMYHFETYRTGDRLNGFTYDEDPEGCSLANIAAEALVMLENRAERRKKEKSKNGKGTGHQVHAGAGARRRKR